MTDVRTAFEELPWGPAPESAAQAREWLEANALMWAVVVKPWVLVQPILKDPDPGTRKDLN